MRSWFFHIALLLACVLPVQAGERFAAVAFHDVVDFRGDLDDDAVTVDRLIGFFEWLRANDWTAISLDDVDAARRGEKSLPERAILLTFDDGYQSVYTRVFPLALAYRYPIVIAIVGSWVDAPMNAKVRYGDRDVPRTRFVTWEQLREMSRSGLVEIASHSYRMHRGVIGNPQGNEMAAAENLRYTRGGGYESESAFRQRILEDLSKSRELLASQMGRPPRTMVWPFGRYGGVGVEVARELGFQFALTLDPEPGDISKPMAIGRDLPINDPKLESIVRDIRFEDPLPSARRLVALNPADVWAGDTKNLDARLGQVIERLRTLGATGIVLDAVETDATGRIVSAWFPNDQIPVRADVLSRIAWQCQTRAGTTAYIRLPASAALRTLGDREKVIALFRDLGSHVQASGLFIEDAPGLAAVGTFRKSAATPWHTRAARKAVALNSLPAQDALALRAFREVEFFRPGLQLALIAEADSYSGPAAIADLTLISIAPQPRAVERLSKRLKANGWLAPESSRRSGLWFIGAKPPKAQDLIGATRNYQIHGGAGIGWAADDPFRDLPKAKTVSPTVSASRYPIKF